MEKKNCRERMAHRMKAKLDKKTYKKSFSYSKPKKLKFITDANSIVHKFETLVLVGKLELFHKNA